MSILYPVYSFLQGIGLSLHCIIHYRILFTSFFVKLSLSSCCLLIGALLLQGRQNDEDEYSYQPCMEYYVVWITRYVYALLFPNGTAPNDPLRSSIDRTMGTVSSVPLFVSSSSSILQRSYTLVLFGLLGLPIILLSYGFGSVYTVKLLEKEVPSACRTSLHPYRSSSSSSSSSLSPSTSFPYTGTSTLTILIHLLYRMLFLTVFNVLVFLLNGTVVIVGQVIHYSLSSMMIIVPFLPLSSVFFEHLPSFVNIIIEGILLLTWSYAYSVALFDQAAVTKENYYNYLLFRAESGSVRTDGVTVSNESTTGTSSRTSNFIESSSTDNHAALQLYRDNLQSWLHRYSIQYRSYIYDHRLYFLSGYSFLPALSLQYMYTYRQSLLASPVPIPTSVWFLHTIGNYVGCNAVYNLLYPLLCRNCMDYFIEEILYGTVNIEEKKDTNTKNKYNYRILSWVHYTSRKIIEGVSMLTTRLLRR